MKGIEAFIYLDTLRCSYNQITSLDLSGNTSLTFLRCIENQLSSLDVSACKALKRLDCDRNLLGTLDISNLLSTKERGCLKRAAPFLCSIFRLERRYIANEVYPSSVFK